MSLECALRSKAFVLVHIKPTSTSGRNDFVHVTEKGKLLEIGASHTHLNRDFICKSRRDKSSDINAGSWIKNNGRCGMRRDPKRLQRRYIGKCRYGISKNHKEDEYLDSKAKQSKKKDDPLRKAFETMQQVAFNAPYFTQSVIRSGR